jgi:predicted nucleic acid-binding protein
MKYLFDSSAIFRAVKENKIEVLTENCTLELARYELGNIIWKDHALQAKISEQESKLMAKTIKHTLAIMNVIGIASNEEEILDIAIKLKITFYDASYAYFAKAKELRLITEDSRLIKRTTATLKVSTLDSVEEKD